jgi:hypothetical protein
MPSTPSHLHVTDTYHVYITNTHTLTHTQALLAILTATHSIVANLIQLPSTSHLGSHGDAIGAGHQPGGAC